MKRKTTIIIAIFMLVLTAFSVARAQLVVVDRKMKVVKTDPVKYRIEITGVDDKPDRSTGYVYVPGDTKCHKDGKLIDWKDLKKGWVIRVKGGVRMDMQVKAEEIWVVKTD